MRGTAETSDQTLAPLMLNAAGADFSYALTLSADRPVVLQGDGGFSRDRQRGDQASYYYSQPFFAVNRQRHCRRQDHGRHWPGLDGPRMEQPAARLRSDRMGLVLAHFASGEKLMLYRMRQDRWQTVMFGDFDLAQRHDTAFAGAEIVMTSKAAIEMRLPPDPVDGDHDPGASACGACSPLNPESWSRHQFFLLGRAESVRGPSRRGGLLKLTGFDGSDSGRCKALGPEHVEIPGLRFARPGMTVTTFDQGRHECIV